MNPVEITQGKSFKGLAKYLLHDARRDGEQERHTAERVGWVQSFNLDGVGGEIAWRRMVATAKSANALKEAAGIKKGKTPAKTVYHYSINFNPKDEVTREIMEKSVAESLAVLGMSHHQALAVEHHDTNHRHVHVMVNLIDPENGMSAATPVMQENGKKASKLSFAQKKLSKWAQKFERDNGLTITEGRLANENKRARGEKVNAKRKSRNVYEREKREATTDRRRDFLKKKHNERAKEIQEQTAELKEQHSHEWDMLKASYSAEKQAIKAEMSPAMKARAAEIKASFKPQWRAMFSRQRREMREFDMINRTTIGNAYYAYRAFKEASQQWGFAGGLIAAFSKEERRNIILRQHDREREKLGREVGAAIAVEMKQMKADFDRQFTQARETFQRNCQGLKTSQSQAWAEIREAWREYNAARSAAFAQTQTRQQVQNRQMQRGRGFEPN